MSNKKPLVSVVVPTFNSAEFLDACLHSIAGQSYKEIELIVVDNHSTDETKEIAKKYTKFVFDKGPERSAQRNYGVEQAHGKYVAIIDSDMLLTSHVIEECVEVAEKNKEIKAVIIPEESFGEGFWAQCKQIEKSFYVGVEWMEAARFFDRDTYLTLGGYNEKMISGEDWDLSQRFEAVGEKSRVNEMILHNEGKLSLLKTLNKKYYYASQINNYLDKNNGTNSKNNQTSILARYKLYFSKPHMFLEEPVYMVGMLFMKTAELGAGFFGLITSKIS